MIAAALVAAALAAPAAATPLLFTISGDYSASFVLDSNPTPDFTDPDRTEFDELAGTYAGGGPTEDVAFFTDAIGGGMSIYDGGLNRDLFNATGAQIYGGTEQAPVFHVGSFSLLEYEGAGSYTLTISDPGAPVPEPAGWATIALGVGMAGGILCRRSRASRVASA